jgi:hypothetical protein
MLDEPKSTEKTFGYATAGWNVAPYAKKIIERVAPLLGVPFSKDLNEAPKLSVGLGRDNNSAKIHKILAFRDISSLLKMRN